MIVPGTRFRTARVAIERIVLTEHQRRYPERVLHYCRLLTDPRHAEHDTGPIALAPHHRDQQSGEQYYTVLDGHHRYVAHVLAGRTHLLAHILYEPGQPGYDECEELEVAS